MSSLRKSAFTKYAGVPEPKLEDVPLQGVGQTGLVLLQEDGRVLRRSGGGVYPALAAAATSGTHGSAAGAEFEKKDDNDDLAALFRMQKRRVTWQLQYLHIALLTFNCLKFKQGLLYFAICHCEFTSTRIHKFLFPSCLSPTLRPAKCTHRFDILFGHEWVQIRPSNIVGGPLQRITFVEAALLGFYLQLRHSPRPDILTCNDLRYLMICPSHIAYWGFSD